ncbi:MAG: aspartyl protease family protein [Deltaproteobacteria bacterium]|nr:aspartyl protease family protein [Deltaproteobacteria bacterium]
MGPLAFERRGGLIVVPVIVWAHGIPSETLHFALDTGTATSILDVNQALRLGLRPDHALRCSRVRSMIGEEFGYVVRAPHISSLGWIRDDFEIACHSFPPGDDIDGLLGDDFFAGLRLVLDYGAGTVELTESLA